MKRSRVAPRSPKRIAETDERAAVRAAVHARDHVCQAIGVIPHHTCAGPLDVDEIIPRSAWPGGHLVGDNCQLLCRRAHDWKGDHPADAHALGLHGYSWERP